jgi:hypothetical protein
MAYTIIRFGNDYNVNTGEVVGGVIGHPGGTNETDYPITLGGVTFGFSTGSSLTLLASGGWLTGDALPLRGRFRVGNPAPRSFRIDVVPGQYRVILGVAAATFQRNRWRVNDGIGGAFRLDLQVSGLGVVRAIGVDSTTSVRVPVDVLSATPTLMQFDTGIIEVINGEFSPSSFNSELSFIAFELVTPPPTVTTITPNFDGIGKQLIISGSNLAGTVSASINNTPMTGIINDSATQVRATVASGTLTGPLRVTTVAGTSGTGSIFTVLTANAFQVVSGSLPEPIPYNVPVNFQVEAIDNLQANRRVTTFTGSVTLNAEGPFPSGSVIVSGTLVQPSVLGVASFTNIYFVAPPTVTAITVGGVPVSSWIVNSTGQITTQLASGTLTGPVVVTTTQGTATGPIYTVTSASVPVTPTVSSIAPTSGPIGTQITFTGTNLTGTSAAVVNGTAMTSIINDSATQIRATVAAGTTTGVTGLTTISGSVTNGPVFTVTTPSVPTPSGSANRPKGLFGSLFI